MSRVQNSAAVHDAVTNEQNNKTQQLGGTKKNRHNKTSLNAWNAHKWKRRPRMYRYFQGQKDIIMTNSAH